MKKIKLTSTYLPNLRNLINQYRDYNYELIEIRPARWYEFPWEHIAIMELTSPRPVRDK